MLLQDLVIELGPHLDALGDAQADTWFNFTRVSFLLPGVAGGGVDSGFDSFGMGMGGGAGFDSVFGGDHASFRSSGGVWEVYLRFFNYQVARFFRLRECCCLGF